MDKTVLRLSLAVWQQRVALRATWCKARRRCERLVHPCNIIFSFLFSEVLYRKIRQVRGEFNLQSAQNRIAL